MRLAALWVVALGVVATGCQQTARLDWEAPPPAAKLTPVYVGTLCADCREGGPWGIKLEGEAVGKHSFTAFGIPVGSINADVNTPVKDSFDRAVRDALRAAGYDPRPAKEAPAGSPVLSGEIRQCFMWSYTWLWPLVVQGGELKVALRVEKAAGTALWSKEFKRNTPGIAGGGAYGFDGMFKSGMSKLLSDLVEECSKPEFRTAVAMK